MPFVSICIPTYNSGEKLVRLLNSIQIQTFKDYEIVISDDSQNDEIPKLIQTNYKHLNIQYFHNTTPLGTPNNWNNAVEKSSGEWIKIMHHDDWFYNKHSLQNFIYYINKNKKAKLIFSAFQFFFTDTRATKSAYCSGLEIFLLKQNYLNLYKNFIGNPSCTLIHKTIKPNYYDAAFKWLIDLDFYTTYFKSNNHFVYVNSVLINMGMHHSQVTSFVQNNPNVEIPESYALFKKHGINILKNIFVYDFFWRMYRNLGIYILSEFELYLNKNVEFNTIKDMLALQKKIPHRILRIGIFSKIIMCYGFIKNRIFN